MTLDQIKPGMILKYPRHTKYQEYYLVTDVMVGLEDPAQRMYFAAVDGKGGICYLPVLQNDILDIVSGVVTVMAGAVDQ